LSLVSGVGIGFSTSVQQLFAGCGSIPSFAAYRSKPRGLLGPGQKRKSFSLDRSFRQPKNSKILALNKKYYNNNKDNLLVIVEVQGHNHMALCSYLYCLCGHHLIPDMV
jgi:hypothetical protein